MGGLIGLGGAEFRLPVLVGLLKRQVREAVPINLAVSLVTIIASLLTRLKVVSEFPLSELLPILLSMILGAVTSAFVAAGVASRISSHVLETWMKFLLISIGLLLIVEGFIPILSAELLHGPLYIQYLVALLAGILIGVVSSTLGVAGGELIIPTLIFIFGIGVKLAGTASLIISLPTVCTGLIRYCRSNAFFSRSVTTQIVIPMGVGSVLGSILGGLLFGFVSPNGLKILLGLILMYSALRMFLRQHSGKLH
ncbi:MAG: hypothetical protein FD147_2577 [Chloroflexi bacterium]|nr:MAG: hypothetical protein FD147_2577 [Chloroflexota bacterium]